MIRAAILLLASIAMTGCASIIDGSTYPVSIHSNPEGADFEISNQSGQVIHRGVTPTVVTLETSAGAFDAEEYKVAFSKEGFEPKTFELIPTMNGWMWGNLLIGGLIGSTIDLSTGAAWDLPAQASGSLKPIQLAAVQSPPSIQTAAKPTESKEDRIAALKQQNLSYADYMAKHREIMNE
jgi:hypothetical protein